MTEQTAPPPYCDSANGHTVVLEPNAGVLYDGLHIDLPPGGNTLFVAISNDGLRFAGSGHGDGRCWERVRGEWFDRGICEGPHSQIYDGHDELVIVRSTRNNTETGAVGWSYLDDDGRLMPSWKVYWDETRGLGEHITHGDVTIGQGAAGGMVAYVRGRRVMILPGNILNIRFRRRLDFLSLAFILDSRTPKFLDMTWAQLDALATDVPPIPPPPNQVPPGVPMNLPKFTISSPTFPVSGEAPLSIPCVATLEPGAGPADWYDWQVSPAHGVSWLTWGGDKSTFTFVFPVPGQYKIRALAGNSAGQWETKAERLVTVTARTEAPTPPPSPSLPPYEPYLQDCAAVAVAYTAHHPQHAKPAPEDMGHLCYRLCMGWTRAQVVQGIADPNYTPDTAPEPP